MNKTDASFRENLKPNKTIELNKKGIIKALKKKEVKVLFEEADNARKAFCGKKVHIRGIIEFSNYCCRSCLYCGLRKENKKILRYRILPDEIVSLANQIVRQGVKTIVLQSGDDFWYSQKMLSGIISRIKNRHSRIAVALCVGERPFNDYETFKNAGADRYLLKHETANPKLYEKLHPGQSFKKRLQILKYLRELGYQIGAGNIVGLPFQTLEDLAEDILLLRDFDVDMAGIGPFIPQKDTPLGSRPSGSLDLTLKVLALTRIVTQNTHLPATTALAVLNPENGQGLGLRAGANVIMPDFTPEDYRRKYQIYDKKVSISLQKAKQTIFKVNRKISLEKGDSLKCTKPQKVCACI